MSWRDKLQPASFRDVPFKVLSISSETGRRTALHQYPFNDEPYAEDLGKEAGYFSVVGYVLQKWENDFDYFADRDALIKALTTKGPGTLVHPWWGSMNVSVLGRAQIKESFAEGGIARFTITFVEAGRVQVPEGVIAPESTADAAADEVEAAAAEEFEEKYESGPLSLLNDTIAFLNMVQNTMYKIQSTVTSKISEALTTVASVRDTINNIIEAPAALAASIQNTFDTYSGLISDSDKATVVDAFLELSKCGETDPSSASQYGGVFEALPDIDTETRRIQANNREHFKNYIRVAALAEALRASAYVTYNGYDDAYSTLTKLMTEVERVQGDMATDVTGDTVYDSIERLKPIIVGILLQKGASAPVTMSKTVPVDPKPSLLWAYELYDDLDREDDIINRNPVVMQHPGFPVGGDDIEVASE